MTTVIFQRYISPQISFEGLPLNQEDSEKDKSWYYKYKNEVFGPYLTKQYAEDNLQIRIMQSKN
jgi:hypothetical protein